MELTSLIEEVKGVGEKTASLFHKLNIVNIKDLIFYIPRGFDLFEEPVVPDAGMKGQVISISAYVKPFTLVAVKKGHLNFTKAVFLCEGKEINAVFFNMPYLKKSINSGEEYILRGVLEVSSKGVLSMAQPKIYTVDNYLKIKNTLQPLYPLTKGLSNNTVSKSIKQVIDKVVIPDDGLDEYCDMELSFPDAIKYMHFPKSLDEFIEARKRIVFHEFVSFIIQMRCDENSTKNLPFDNPMIESAFTSRLIEALPYELTNAQKKVWSEIESDMCGTTCMNRMVQGDVGSGKTIIAFLALLLNAANNHQGAMMAPTEVLAKQHFENIQSLIKKYKLPLNPVLLLGSMSLKQRKEAYEQIKSGEVNVVIGTHAIFQSKAEFNDLTFVCTDEQHRFGVKQREQLVNKGAQVHLLVMSATPIPRSLAFVLYGDVSISVIDELPSRRLPIKNCVVNTGYRQKAYEFIEKEVKAGHQAYVICPMVEEGLDDDLENVVDYCAKLKNELSSNIIVQYLHGKMTLDKKNEIMDAFARKEIDVLVSTTVIEVGIDVPNSTVMMVENSERFGLATLHQLRGRVGRGDSQSYCIFVTSKEDDKTMERLNILNKSNDGFFIADEDLRLRGPGDIFGIRQSGEFGFGIGDIYNDADILREASNVADILMKKDNADVLNDIIIKLKLTTFNFVDFRTI